MSAWDDFREEPLNIPALTVHRNDRYASLLMVLVTVGALALGLLLRQSELNSTFPFVDRTAGIQTRYPAGWLLDAEGDYVMRVRDPSARPFKTTYQVQVVPASPQTSVRNVLDNLTLQRSSELAAYQVLSVQEVPGEVTRMDFAFVDTDPNPFLQRLPVVVLGTDLVVLDGNRAIVVTFMSAEDIYDRELPRFQRFFLALSF
jgi:hypothetical protein